MTESTPTDEAWTSGSGRVWARRVFSGLGLVALLVVVAAAGTIWWIDRGIERVDVEGLGETPSASDLADLGGSDGGDGEDDPADDASALTVLVIGSDSREELTAEQRAEFGTGDFEGQRAEVISLVRLAPVAEEMRILNLPRDARVERCDGSVGKINEAFDPGLGGGEGGVSCIVRTVSEVTDVVIDHVVIVDFEGFVDVIDRLGGVTMYLEEPLHDEEAHLDLPAGCVELDGVDALAFARARHIDDDYGRIARQQRLVRELQDEIADLGAFDDLPRLLSVARAVAGSVELDSSLDLGRLQQLVREHRRTLRGDLEGRAAPGDLAAIDGVSYVELDEDRLAELVSWLRTGVDPAERDTADEAASAGDDEEGPKVGGDAAHRDPAPSTLQGDAPAGTGGEDAEGC